jgi:hypothetical protein
MTDTDDDVPDTETRRRSYRRLAKETWLSDAPEDGIDEAKQREAARKRAAQRAEGLGLPLQTRSSSPLLENATKSNTYAAQGKKQ